MQMPPLPVVMAYLGTLSVLQEVCQAPHMWQLAWDMNPFWTPNTFLRQPFHDSRSQSIRTSVPRLTVGVSRIPGVASVILTHVACPIGDYRLNIRTS
eukprot:scaffold563_cov410-Prasinococcus_capsulatus_cf.AAC.9